MCLCVLNCSLWDGGYWPIHCRAVCSVADQTKRYRCRRVCLINARQKPFYVYKSSPKSCVCVGQKCAKKTHTHIAWLNRKEKKLMPLFKSINWIVEHICSLFLSVWVFIFNTIDVIIYDICPRGEPKMTITHWDLVCVRSLTSQLNHNLLTTYCSFCSTLCVSVELMPLWLWAGGNAVATYFISTLGCCQPITQTKQQYSVHLNVYLLYFFSISTHASFSTQHILWPSILRSCYFFFFLFHWSRFLCLSQIFGITTKTICWGVTKLIYCFTLVALLLAYNVQRVEHR